MKHIVALFFLCSVGSVEVKLSPEHQECTWVSPDELEAYGDSIEKEIKEAIILANL